MKTHNPEINMEVHISDMRRASSCGERRGSTMRGKRSRRATPHNNKMQGTPQAYLSFVVVGCPEASMAVKGRLTGAPDLCPICELADASTYRQQGASNARC